MSNVMNEPKWWHGESDEAEQWFGPHDTREQCISKGVSYHEGEPFVITQAKTALLSFEFDEQDVEQFLENCLEEDNCEAISEYGEITSPTDEQVTELMHLLNKAVYAWTDKYPELTLGTMLEMVGEHESIDPKATP